MSWLDKLKSGLKKTAGLFTARTFDAASVEELEEALIRADVGLTATRRIMQDIQSKKSRESDEIRAAVGRVLVEKMQPVARPLTIDAARKPYVILVVGVNGVGKTTTIGKLARQYRDQGLKVSLVAGDTFRAGAVEQLQLWGDKTGCRVHAGKPGADAAGLVFDALAASRKAGDDVLLIDTAGRLHNRADLMDELKKIVRVIQKADASAPHAVELVLDATTGQNALTQVKIFQEMVGVTGLIMTKLDGTAKGGILVALADAYPLPIHAVGVGEQADDLHAFTAAEYVDSLLGGA
ncbi:MAG: signal recognition particle-docking protein FtsY [Alphaproteobacteria bacterium]|nr:signal recognition particle-docking protein FtsY [Alphaproteobacteria bacterium]